MTPLFHSLKQPKGWAGIFAEMVSGGALFVLIVSVAAYIDSDAFAFELVSHFPTWYLGAGGIAFVLGALLRDKRTLTISGLCIFLNVYPIAQLYGAGPHTAHASTRAVSLKAVSANVMRSNQELGSFPALAAGWNADVLVVHEVGNDVAAVLPRLHTGYPYHAVSNERGCFGVGIFSQHPIQAHEFLKLDSVHPPVAVASIEIGGQAIDFYGVHTLPPGSQKGFSFQVEHLKHLAGYIAERRASTGSPIVLLGDLNASPWATILRRFLHETDLRDSRQGYGVKGTFPAYYPRAMRIPIDYVLVSPEFDVRSFYTLHIPGSDHNGAAADLTIPKPSGATQ